ncbi:MAG: hypothetical protein EZS28_013232 [Streblomastix strix]|uniref:Uncharacterized protein n=1 Tax=Streblomastix strix TaxID=222440 RepID=A0A5J4W9C1_9EUKA|nr:MAG: hypothetical protein EZS28_013232 [Streblomastix strix]
MIFGTICELRPTKVHCKDICHDYQRAIGNVKRDWEVSSVRAAADATRNRATTPEKTVSERTQTLMAKVVDAVTGVQASEIDFWATNVLNEQNGGARRREIQCPSLLLIISVPVLDEILDSLRSPIDKILQNEQALTLQYFRIGEGILAHLCDQQQDQLAIDVLGQMIHNLREAERTHFASS